MRWIGVVGSAVQLALAVLLSGIATRPDEFPNPPEPIPRGLALALLYALPAAIGALGALGARRALLAAAAVLSSVGSVVAFSGVTLIFLVPAVLFAAAAGATSTSIPPARPSWRTLALLALAMVAVIVASLRIGIFVLPLIVLLLLLLEVGRGAGRTRVLVQPGGVLLTVGIVALGVGAGWALLSMTETRCWKAYQTPAGIEYQAIPDPGDDPIALGREAIAGGCDSSVLTVAGAAAASFLGLTAVALAAPGSGWFRKTNGTVSLL